jgi:gas vesicle protein
MENSTNNGKLIGALLLGAAIGGALGILFAPDKGSATRKKILTKGEDVTDDLKEKFNDLIAEVKKQMETAKNKAVEISENGVTKAEKLKVN